MAAALSVRKAGVSSRTKGNSGGGDDDGVINMTLNPVMLTRGNHVGDGDLLSEKLLESITEAPNAVQVHFASAGVRLKKT